MKNTIEQITDQLEQINLLISQQIDESDYPTLLSYLNELSSWQGNSGKCVADAEYYYNEKLLEVFQELKADGSLNRVPATIITNYTKAKCKELIHLVKLAERYNRGITHRCDSIRSILSFAKSEMIR